MAIAITVNGDTRELSEGATLGDLVRALELDPKTVAALVNDDVVPRDHFEEQRLNAGDAVELVRFVPGG